MISNERLMKKVRIWRFLKKVGFCLGAAAFLLVVGLAGTSDFEMKTGEVIYSDGVYSIGTFLCFAGIIAGVWLYHYSQWRILGYLSYGAKFLRDRD